MYANVTSDQSQNNNWTHIQNVNDRPALLLELQDRRQDAADLLQFEERNGLLAHKIIFPPFKSKILPGWIQRKKDQRTFAERLNPTMIPDDDETMLPFRLNRKKAETIDVVNDTFSVDLIGAGAAQRQAHAQQIVVEIQRLEAKSYPKEMLHMYVGRHYGKTLSSLLNYIQRCAAHKKAGYMRLYRSHLIHCGDMRCSEDEGICTLVHLEELKLLVCTNLMNASDVESKCCCHGPDGSCLGLECTHIHTVYYLVYSDPEFFHPTEDWNILFPQRIVPSEVFANAHLKCPDDDNRVNKETHGHKKRKMEKDEESMAEMKPGWKYDCSHCRKSGVDTFRIQWNEPDLSLSNNGQNKSFQCHKRCKKYPEEHWKKNARGVFKLSSVWCKTPYRFLEKINVPIDEDES